MSEAEKCGFDCSLPLDIWGHACRFCMATEIERLREIEVAAKELVDSLNSRRVYIGGLHFKYSATWEDSERGNPVERLAALLRGDGGGNE